jgi:diguanylate cyclase (GGDEF)-like protein
MEEVLLEEDEDIEHHKFLSIPVIQENYKFLQDIGVVDYIDTLNRDIRNYRNFLARGLDIFNHTSIDKIMDATVYQISDQFVPSFLAFVWKPIQTREDITIKAYMNYKPVDINLHVDCITPFEEFFKKYPKPINFELLAFQLNNDEAVKPYLDIHTEIAVPILGPFGLYGIVLVGRKMINAGYTRDELFFLQQLMCFVSQAIKNHLHYEHSLHDIKTGLYNHGFFMSRLGEEISRVKRGSYQSSLVVIDVDKFKKFNDSYGHLAGDKVLEDLAQVIRRGVRDGDITSRFGGEEFTILLPHTDKDTAWSICERLRISVSEMKVEWDVPLPQVTISLGIYTFDQTIGSDVDNIVRNADEALYISKDRGRNRCTMWEPEIVKPHPDESVSVEKTNEKTKFSDHRLEMI